MNCIDDIWKMVFEEIDDINEITDVKFNQLDVEHFSREELDEILNFLCTS